jgi:flagellar M-ring protein FliF
VQTENGTSTYESSERTRNYEINETETTTQYAFGSPDYEHVTAAVLVDSRVETRVGAADDERVNKIKGIIAAACGLKNGETALIDDSVSIAFIEFYSEEEPGDLPVSPLIKYFPYLLAAAALLILLLVLLLLSLRKRKAKKALGTSEIVRDIEVEEPVGIDHTIEEGVSLSMIYEPELTPEEIELNRVKAEIEKMVQENPESAVQVVRAWLMEDQR